MFRIPAVLVNLFLALLSLTNIVVAQQRHAPQVISYLLRSPDTLNTISGWLTGLLPGPMLPEGLGMDYQYLLKDKEGLYCGINGSGQLYNISDSNGYLSYQRVDATNFNGHNFFAANFYYGGHFYSLGGYGFWHQNGMLRKYNAFTRDWQPVMLDQERPLMASINGFFWLDAAEGKVYANTYLYRLEGFRKPPNTSNDSLMLSSLDLNTGVWHDLGRMNKLPVMNLQTNFGVVELGVYDASWYDFRHNRVYSAGKALKDKLTRLTAGLNNNLYFYKDSTLYFANLNNDVFDSITLTARDFVFSGTQLYSNVNLLSGDTDSVSPLWRMIALGGVLLFIGLFIRQRRITEKAGHLFDGRGSGKNDITVKEPESLIQKDPAAIFTALELELLKFIFSRDGEKEPVRVDEVNKLLGLSEKNESVQKKNRNEVINSVNQKWVLIGGGTPSLLNRERSADDKRTYYYSVNPDARKLLAGFLQG